MQERTKTTLRNLTFTVVLLTVSVTLAYAFGEIIVRIWMPQPMLPRYVTNASYGVRKNMPDVSIWHSSPDYRVNVRTNSRGVRSDRDIPYQKPEGTFRIVGLGDSFTLGYEVEQEDTFLYQLETNLKDRGFERVEVINLGVSGFGTSEELITLKEEGMKYDPDMVILGYFVNDIQNNIMSDLFAIEDDSLRQISESYLPAVGVRNLLFSIPLYRYMADNSQLLNLFRNFISYQIQQAVFRENRGGPDETPSEEEFEQIVQYESALTARLLDQIYLECRDQNIPFVLLNIPTTEFEKKSVYSNIPIDEMKFSDRIVYVDAIEIVKPYVGERPVQWEKWHGHWLPWVHHLVGEVLADRVAPYLSGGGDQIQESESIVESL